MYFTALKTADFRKMFCSKKLHSNKYLTSFALDVRREVCGSVPFVSLLSLLQKQKQKAAYEIILLCVYVLPLPTVVEPEEKTVARQQLVQRILAVKIHTRQ
jgi:hypothetical protein